MASPRHILLDVDDCTLPTDGKVTLGFYEGLAELWQLLTSLQGKVGFCTGRDRNYVEACAFFLGLLGLNSWSVIESGIALFNPVTKDVLPNPALTPKVRETFLEIRRSRIPMMLRRLPGLLDYPGNEIIVALERHQEQRSIEECSQVVKEELGDLEKTGLIIIHHSSLAVDISPVGEDGVPIDKASGVRFLSKVLGIDPLEMAGVGDSRGDFPMLNLVGKVGCPSNAAPACKTLVEEKGGYISPFLYTQGVADCIRHFMEE